MTASAAQPASCTAVLTRAVAILLVLVGLPAGAYQHLRAAHLLYFGAPDQGSVILIEARKSVARDEPSLDRQVAPANGGEPPAAAPASAVRAAPAAATQPLEAAAPRTGRAAYFLPSSTGPPRG